MFLVYVDDIHQAVKSNLLSYADDSGRLIDVTEQVKNKTTVQDQFFDE